MTTTQVTIKTTAPAVTASFNINDAIKAGAVLVNKDNIQSKANEMTAKYTKSMIDERIKKAKEAGVIIIDSTNYEEILNSVILAIKTKKQFAFTSVVTGTYVKYISSIARLRIQQEEEDKMRKNNM